MQQVEKMLIASISSNKPWRNPLEASSYELVQRPLYELLAYEPIKFRWPCATHIRNVFGGVCSTPSPSMLSQTLTKFRIASVAMIPETESRDSPGENGLKRRNSEILEQEQKRHKTNSGKNSPTAKKEEEEIGTREKIDLDQRATGAHSDKAAADTRASRKKTGVTDEKQRSKRLFGAFLGNLNRPSDQVSKRRAEIEQRRKAELQKQDDERLEDRQKRLENLTVQRQKGQIQVDEQNVGCIVL